MPRQLRIFFENLNVLCWYQRERHEPTSKWVRTSPTYSGPYVSSIRSIHTEDSWGSDIYGMNGKKYDRVKRERGGDSWASVYDGNSLRRQAAWHSTITSDRSDLSHLRRLRRKYQQQRGLASARGRIDIS